VVDFFKKRKKITKLKKNKALRVLYCFNEKWITMMLFNSFNRKVNKLISHTSSWPYWFATKERTILARLIILKLTASLEPSPREGSNPSARSYVIMAMRSHLKVDLILYLGYGLSIYSN